MKLVPILSGLAIALTLAAVPRLTSKVRIRRLRRKQHLRLRPLPADRLW